MKIPFFTCGLSFQSDKSIEEVGQILSEILFGGLPFGGKDKFIHDEVPAIFIKQPVMGLSVILYGFGGEDGFILEMHPATKLCKRQGDEYNEFKLDNYIENLLNTVQGIKVDLS